jgi:TonB family protein
MEMLRMHDKRFKRAVIFSVSVHVLLFVMLVVSPHLPKSQRTGMIHYVELMSFGGGGGRSGGGGGGGGAPAPKKTESQVETAVPERQSLRDLTTPQKLEESRPPAMTHPVDKPQRDSRPAPEKKAVIQKSQPGAKRTSGDQGAATEGTGSGGSTGSRVGLGIGSGEGGFGFGESYGGGTLANFPYMYYVNEIRSRISNNWQTSLIRSGTTGNDFAEVRFRIFRNGRISEPVILRSSGNQTMNSSAIRALRNASPFPPLPRGYTDEYLIVRLFFEHNR